MNPTVSDSSEPVGSRWGQTALKPQSIFAEQYDDQPHGTGQFY